MATIGEQIKAARKAKGMTQEELAEATHMTRTGISKWETDSRRPDEKMMARLSEVLGCEFEIPEGLESLPAENDEQETEEQTGANAGAQAEAAGPAQETAGAHPGRKSGSRRKVILGCVIAAVLVIAGFVLALTLGNRTEQKSQDIVYTDAAGKVYDPAYYKAVKPNEAGKAYIKLDTELNIQQLSHGEHFLYAFNMKEENGIGFHIDRMDHINFFYSGAVTMDTLTAEDVESWGDDPHIPPYGTYSITCGVSGRSSTDGAPNAVGAALFLVGTDDNGEQLTFTAYIPLPIE